MQANQFFRGLIYGLALSVPFWVLVCAIAYLIWRALS
jgi:hypothetical protein